MQVELDRSDLRILDLVQQHGDPDSWGNFINLTFNGKPLTDTQAIDIYRLRTASGATSASADYVTMADVAANGLRYPAEAEAMIEQGTRAMKTTLERVLPYWHSRIAPELRAGRNVMVTAHGNSLRAMVKMLDNVAEKDIVELNIPTGVPLLYELDAKLSPISSRYLGDPAAIAAARGLQYTPPPATLRTLSRSGLGRGVDHLGV